MGFKIKVFVIFVIYLTAIELTAAGSSTVHSYTQTVHRTTHLTNWEDCGLCPVFASYSLAFDLLVACKFRATG